jgi:N-acetyl sugar amidotransferase
MKAALGSSIMRPFLAGEKVILRPLAEADGDGGYPHWFNDAEVCLGNSHHVYPYTREQALEFIRALPGKKNMLALAVIEKAGGKHVGNISLQEINYIHRSAELAIIIGDKASWDRGLGKEAARLLAGHGFMALNLNRIWSGTFESNIGFQKVASSLGMRLEGRRRQAAYKDGRWLDVLEYGLLRGEFEKTIGNESLPSHPLQHEGLKYCTRCCIPETQEGVSFDELGVCQACQSSEQKMHIDWAKRERALRDILHAAKMRSGTNYDCLLPISGGKDSFFQAHVIARVYGLKPLAVTFSHNLYSETGYHNLQLLLETFNIDHIQLTPNRGLVNRLLKKSIYEIGDACWHCHAGVGAFPLQIAVKFKIPLLIWGESLAESSGRASYAEPLHKFDRDYFLKVSAKVTADKMRDDSISESDMRPFELPSYEEIEAVGVHGIHLGDFIFWDDERQTEFIRDTYGWRETEMEGSYKGYKSAECVMAGMHDFTCYLKRGFGRGTAQAAADIRAGLLTRDEGLRLAALADRRRPEVLDYYLRATGLREEEFYEALAAQRHEKLRGRELPVTPRDRPNRERLLPYPQQVIERLKGRPDPREE